MDMNVNLLSAFSTGRLNTLVLQNLKKSDRSEPSTPKAPAPAPKPDPSRSSWGAHYTAPLREASETVAATARVDQNFDEIQQTLGQMRQIAQQIKDGDYEGEFTELPEGEGYQEAMAALIDSAPEESDQAQETERPHIGMLAKEFSTMADKVGRLLDETLAEDRDLLRDKVFAGSEPAFESLENITLSNTVDGTLNTLSDAMTETLATRGQLQATRTTAESDMAEAVSEINQAYRMSGGQAPEEASQASELVEKIRQMLTQSPDKAVNAQSDQRYMPPAEMLAGLIY
jgi:hypothetical protein